MNRYLIQILRPLLKKPYRLLDKWLLSLPRRLDKLEKNQEKVLFLRHNDLIKDQDQKQKFRMQEFGVYSQHGEDGILLYIFSQINTKNNTFVEFGIDDGRECNTANLSINFGWNGLLLEKSSENVQKAKKFYKKNLGNKSDKVVISRSTVNADNINRSLEKNNIIGEIDLLSIDIDGNDYWVWKSIGVIDPRVVVIEYNAVYGPKKSITIPYNPDFYRFDANQKGLYYGASLKALNKLGEEKGYILVACDSSGTNSFFVRKDLIKKNFIVLDSEDAYYPSYERSKDIPTTDLFREIKDYSYQKI